MIPAFLWLLSISTMLAQTQPAAAAWNSAAAVANPACKTLQIDQFDFWVGEWHAVWTAAGKPGKGHNSIRRTLGGCVVEERFTGDLGGEQPLIGMSVSAF
ncbi:MAG: hypothetical protein ACRD2R_05085 [Terriglobales bacterium]